MVVGFKPSYGKPVANSPRPKPGGNFNNNNSRPKFYKSSMPSSRQSPPYNNSVSCYYCKCPGHLEKDCGTKKDMTSESPRPQAHCVTLQDSAEASPSALQLFATSMDSSGSFKDHWFFDTGATHHMTYNQTWLVNYVPLSTPLAVLLGDDSVREAAGFGQIHIILPNGQTTYISKVYYVPGLFKKSYL